MTTVAQLTKFGIELNDWMDESNLSITQTATLMGYSAGYVRKLMYDDEVPLQALIAIARAGITLQSVTPMMSAHMLLLEALHREVQELFGDYIETCKLNISN